MLIPTLLFRAQTTLPAVALKRRKKHRMIASKIVGKSYKRMLSVLTKVGLCELEFDSPQHNKILFLTSLTLTPWVLICSGWVTVTSTHCPMCTNL